MTFLPQLRHPPPSSELEAGFQPTLTPFYTLFSVKFLTIAFDNRSLSEVLKLICSFPLLEDLEMTNYQLEEIDDINRTMPHTQPFTPAPLNGVLTIKYGVAQATKLLLHLQGHHLPTRTQENTGCLAISHNTIGNVALSNRGIRITTVHAPPKLKAG